MPLVVAVSRLSTEGLLHFVHGRKTVACGDLYV